MSRYGKFIAPTVALCAAVMIMGCSSVRAKQDPAALKALPRPAYSVSMPQPEMIVAVSPVRQTLQIGGSIPTLLGAGISAVQDDRYAGEVLAALGDYDAGAVLVERIEAGLGGQFGPGLERVPPAGTAAGHHNQQEARKARLAALRRAGRDAVLDLELAYGIYGPEGMLVVKIAGELTDLAKGRVLWRNSMASYSTELFADERWRDPMQRMTPNITAPRLAAGKTAVSQWTEDGGARLKASFEQAADDVTAALLADLGLAESARGLCVLGAQLALNGDNAEAAARFKRALELEPDLASAANGLAVALARNKQVDEAVALAQALTKAHPDYMPGWYNLAWWLAVELEDAEQARPCFEKAVALGAAPSRRLERALR